MALAIEGFNTTLVQLKAHVHPHVATIPIVFQYHSGPIKSTCTLM